MRLLRVYIDGYRNLKNVMVDFDKDSLTTVVIGENGSGKSNLIEAIVEVFRAYDLRDKSRLNFSFEIEYKINKTTIKLFKKENKLYYIASVLTHFDDGSEGFKQIGGGERVPKNLFPDLIFGYYSGNSRRLEECFDQHQSNYYSIISKNRFVLDYDRALLDRRLFFCRPIHGVLALLSFFAASGQDSEAGKILFERLNITGFHSALALFKEPSWFSGSSAASKKSAGNVWGAHGPAGDCARAIRDAAFHPLKLESSIVDDYRHKAKKEVQLACFLRNKTALDRFASSFKVPSYDDDYDYDGEVYEYPPPTDNELFAALEAVDISDLFREVIVWVTRRDDDTGNISFSDLSDGERQLLMVLGLIRVSRGKEALFLLDEPDTHLNPSWQLTYLDLIREWTEVAADEDECQIIMTTHNPLTIAALTKKEVRVMQKGEGDQIIVSEPYADPRGLGFTSTLTEIFGLPTTLDPDTQKQIDERNRLARIDERSEKQERMLIELNDKLDRLGFMHESRDPLYDDFLKAVHDVKYADRPPMTQEQIEKRRLAMQALIKSLSAEQGKAH